jgi:thiamine-monophosphate kinase
MESEDLLISRIARAVPSAFGRSGGELRLGIGDDAAVLRPSRGFEWVVSCDAFIEGIHFLAAKHPADSIGYKSIARATSDLAAMGAVPSFFLMALSLPRHRTGRWLDEFLAGAARAANELGLRLVGGDTTQSESIGLNITVLGRVPTGLALTRSGARAGDLIYVSGELGKAKLGLELVLRGADGRRKLAKLLERHLYPRIRVDLGERLSRGRIASAAMDISDGLSTDLMRLTRASRVGAIIHSDRIPTVRIPKAVHGDAKDLGLNPLEMALHGGEDYELLFTVPPKNVKRLRAAAGSERLSCLGEITAGRRVLLVDGEGHTKPLMARGWDPFRK